MALTSSVNPQKFSGPLLRIWFSAVVLILTAPAIADRFTDMWYDGNGEISTYEISESRYGELREGRRIMIFVTEPLRLATGIKPDARLPDGEKVDVMKLNDVREFNTGVYDYSVMTSVFSAVEAKPNIPLGATVKVSFTGQEWCGNVFERYLRREREFQGMLFSYFESEGERRYSLPTDGKAEAEENLWIKIREFKGGKLEYGGEMAIRIIPSMWSRRKSHTPPHIEEGRLKKGYPGKEETALGVMEAVPFTWTVGGKSTVVSVEKDWPHRILAWNEPDGSSGKILVSRRVPYWQLHERRHRKLRDEFNLTVFN